MLVFGCPDGGRLAGALREQQGEIILVGQVEPLFDAEAGEIEAEALGGDVGFLGP